MTPNFFTRARVRLSARAFIPAVAVAALVFTTPHLVGPTDTPEIDLAHSVDAGSHTWRVSEASWYGPGLHGRGTACGQVMSPDLQGVAHKSLPCGTLVRFEWHGTEVVVPVVDRGPYVREREWDLTQATCERLGRCYTAAVASTL